MGINVFEGARRIAKLVTLLWVVGCVIYTTNDALDLRKQNLEAQIKQVPLVKDTSDQGDKTALYAEFERWKANRQSQNNQPPIDEDAYMAKARELGYLKDQQSQELPDFTPEEIAAYRAKEQQEAGQKIWEHIGTGSLWLFGGVAFIWASTYAIGWIVRGFFGIPSGHDFKP
jgi:hypothetical protein